MLFHNAVMRWKCSLLNEDERREIEDWIATDMQRQWDEVQHLWKAMQTKGVDELTTKNQYIQKYVYLIS